MTIFIDGNRGASLRARSLDRLGTAASSAMFRGSALGTGRKETIVLLAELEAHRS